MSNTVNLTGSAGSQTFSADRVGSVPQPDAYGATLFRLSDIRGYTQHLTGRLKTLIDGAVVDTTQRKALKDLIHTMAWDEHYTAMLVWAETAIARQQSGNDACSSYRRPPFSSGSNIAPDGDTI